MSEPEPDIAISYVQARALREALRQNYELMDRLITDHEQSASTAAEAREPVLCYVEGNCAWFTTQPLGDQWGDDWDDAPYEHNAGSPYTAHTRDLDPWHVYSVLFATTLVEPRHGAINSTYSVEAINKGVIPWLRPYEPEPWEQPVETAAGPRIMAGVTLAMFRKLIRESGGCVSEVVHEQ